MLYPALNSMNVQRQWTEQFLGLDRRPRTYDGAFGAMGNMTGDPWPLMSSRGKRGVVAELERPLGLMALGKLAWIDGDTLYYGGEKTPIQDLSLEEDMLPKRMVSMGAYIIVFPDGKYVNTVDMDDHGSLNRLYESQGNVTYTLCDMDGIDYPMQEMYFGETAPENPLDGAYWLNTEENPHALYQYHDEWIGVSSVYVRIQAEGIGKGLSVQDSVTLSGIAYEGEDETLKDQLDFLNETQVVQAVEDDYIVVIGVIDQKCTQKKSSIRADRTFPKLDYVIECNNRLWGCRYGEEDGEFVNRIYACALGDFKNWRKYLGTSLDSYYVNVGTDGPFTGAAAHRGNPYFFKENCVHKIFGEIPANYQAQVTLCDGVQQGSDKTLVPWNGTLFYLGRHGPQQFESLPTAIGKALGEGKLKNGAAGQAGGKYYLSAEEEDGNSSLYVLDTERGNWYRQDDSKAVSFAELNGEMYMLGANGMLYALNGEAGEKEKEPVTWFAETAVMGYDYPDHQYMSRFVLRMKLGKEAECALYIQYDSDGIWHFKGRLQGQGRVKTYLAPIVPRRCEHMKIRIEGHGDMQLYGLARELALGSDGR